MNSVMVLSSYVNYFPSKRLFIHVLISTYIDIFVLIFTHIDIFVESLDSMAQIGHANGDGWQEEVYQKVI